MFFSANTRKAFFNRFYKNLGFVIIDRVLGQ